MVVINRWSLCFTPIYHATDSFSHKSKVIIGNNLFPQHSTTLVQLSFRQVGLKYQQRKKTVRLIKLLEQKMNLFTHNKVIQIFALILILLPSISMAGKHHERGYDNDSYGSERYYDDSHSKHKHKRHKREHQDRYDSHSYNQHQRKHYRKHHDKHGHDYRHYDRHERHYNRHHRNNHRNNHYTANHRPHRVYQDLRFLFGLHRGGIDIHYGH